MITRSQSKNLESPPSSGDSAEDLSQQTAKIEDSLSDALGLSKNKKTTLNKLSSDARASGSPSPNVKSNQSLGSHDNRNVAFGPKNVHDRTSFYESRNVDSKFFDYDQASRSNVASSFVRENEGQKDYDPSDPMNEYFDQSAEAIWMRECQKFVENLSKIKQSFISNQLPPPAPNKQHHDPRQFFSSAHAHDTETRSHHDMTPRRPVPTMDNPHRLDFKSPEMGDDFFSPGGIQYTGKSGSTSHRSKINPNLPPYHTGEQVQQGERSRGGNQPIFSDSLENFFESLSLDARANENTTPPYHRGNWSPNLDRFQISPDSPQRYPHSRPYSVDNRSYVPSRSTPPKPRTDRPPVQLPRGLEFDGTTSWRTFKSKFVSFLVQFAIHDKNSVLYYFSMALSGRAGNFFSRIKDSVHLHNIDDLFRHMEDRFDDNQLSQTALVQFQTVRQERDEPVKVWADRVWSLAYQAFPSLPPSEIERQVILRFSLALYNKDAARHLSSQEFKSLSDVMKAYEIFDYASRATRDAYDNSKPDPKSRLRKLVDEDAVKVNAVSDKDFNDLIESFRGQKAQIQFLTNWMKRLADRFKLFDKSSNNDNSRSSLRSNSNDKSDQSSPGTQNKVRFSSPARNPLKTNIRSESPSRERRKCYLCGEEGHVAAHCRLDKSKSKVMTVSFENFTSDDSDSDSSVSPKDLGLDL